MSAHDRFSRSVFLWALLAACAEEPPPLVLGEVVPDSVVEGTAQQVVIRGQFAPRAVTAFDEPRGSVLDATFRVHLGELRLGGVRLTPSGLEVDIPADLAPGAFDVMVTDPYERSASLSEAFKVLARPDPSARPSAFRFDALGPQQAGVPFPVTLTALDASSAPLSAFSGDVALADLTGTLVPAAVSLVSGVWQGLVEVRQPIAADHLRASFQEIATVSNDFAVAPAGASCSSGESPDSRPSRRRSAAPRRWGARSSTCRASTRRTTSKRSTAW